jgi:teichuronic acid biosynthesis glycosyltransferase TuaG
MNPSAQALPSNGVRPMVSVVIPCFNGSRYLSRTIESVLAQTWADLEVIVVDDCSSDDSVEVAQRHGRSDARVRVIRRERNAGTPAAPRNDGTAAALGHWVAFLDADDIWHPRKLELQMKVLGEQGAALCSTRMRDFRKDSEIVFDAPRNPRIQRITWGMQIRKYRTPTSSIVVRRDLMLQHPFNEESSYKAREDTDCFIRLHEEIGSSVKILHPLVFYRLQEQQISRNKWKMVGRHLQMLRQYRRRDGRPLGALAYVYTFTHFLMSIYLRSIRRML